MKSLSSSLLAVSLAALGCSGETGDGEGESTPRVLEHTFPAISVDPYYETSNLCQTWTLDNEEPLYVNTVSMQNGGGLHHSNWFFVSEDVFDGPDGTWECGERDWDMITAVLSGGVLFAQSTQARQEAQRFPDKAVYEIPPHSRIVGNLHILNASEAPLETEIHLEIETLPLEEAGAFLSPMSLSYEGLDIPPKRKSRMQGTCDFTESYGAPIDFNFYYVLPHYHELGTGTFLQATGMPGGGEEMIYQQSDEIGEVLSTTLDPPLSPEGATDLHFGCDFTNPRDQTVGYGIGDQEMCIIVAWQDSGFMFHASVGSTEEVWEEDGVEVHEGDCQVAFFTDR